MELRDLINFVVLIVVLQTGLGIILFLLMSGTPGINLYSAMISIFLLITVSSTIGVFLYWLIRRYTKERAIKTAMMAMTDDEKRVLRKVMNQGEIRQDELRKQVDFSKSKLSALLSNLEEKNAIEKKRYKRTNKVRPTEDFRQ